MKFEDTGLPKEKLVEDAFNYAYAHNQSLAPEVEQQIRQQIDAWHQNQMFYLEEDKKDGVISEEQYKAEKAQIDGMLAMEEKRLPQAVQLQLGQMFKGTILAPVQEIQQHSEQSPAPLLAAALLLGSVRDTVDHQKVDAHFGGAISGLIAEILHIDAYPGTREANLAAASSDAKRIYMAELTCSLTQIAAQVERPLPGQQIMLPPKLEETAFAEAKQLWGNDKKQDTHLAAVFNRAAQALSSKFRIEVTADGTPALVQNAQKTPSALPPAKKSGPKITGD